MTPRAVLIFCERAPVKVNPVPAVRYHLWPGDFVHATGGPIYCPPNREVDAWLCSYCGRRVQVVA